MVATADELTSSPLVIVKLTTHVTGLVSPTCHQWRRWWRCGVAGGVWTVGVGKAHTRALVCCTRLLLLARGACGGAFGGCPSACDGREARARPRRPALTIGTLAVAGPVVIVALALSVSMNAALLEQNPSHKYPQLSHAGSGTLASSRLLGAVTLAPPAIAGSMTATGGGGDSCGGMAMGWGRKGGGGCV